MAARAAARRPTTGEFTMAMNRVSQVAFILAAVLGSAAASAADPAKAPYSPYVTQNMPTRVYFGDTHLHTAASFDAGAFGARLTPRDAYRFARGEQIMASSGQPASLSRPLDFLVVSDHSDNMGFFPDFFAGKPELLKNPQGKKWYDMIKAGQGERGCAGDHHGLLARARSRKTSCTFPGTPAYKAAWDDNIAAAEQYN